MSPGALQQALQQARERVAGRAELVEEVRATLRGWADRAAAFEPFEHGSLWMQLAYEANTIRIERGDAARELRRKSRELRRKRRHIPREKRLLVFERDDFTCADCGWRCPEMSEPAPEGATQEERQRLRHLTVDHLVPVAEGGTNDTENLRTMCATCNRAKGRQLPQAVAA